MASCMAKTQFLTTILEKGQSWDTELPFESPKIEPNLPSEQDKSPRVTMGWGQRAYTLATDVKTDTLFMGFGAGERAATLGLMTPATRRTSPNFSWSFAMWIMMWSRVQMRPHMPTKHWTIWVLREQSEQSGALALSGMGPPQRQWRRHLEHMRDW